MSTKKNVMKFVIILVAAFVIAAGGYFALSKLDISTQQEAPENGIYIVTEDGIIKDPITGAAGIISITEDNCTIKGTAFSDMFISVDEDVKNLTIENVDCAGNLVDIYMDNTKDTTLTFNGTNNVTEVYSFGNLVLQSGSGSDELNIKYSLEGERIDILSGTIRASSIYSFNNVNIKGNPKVYITGKAMTDECTNTSAVEVSNKLTIDLRDDGVFDVDSGKQFNDAVFVFEGIILGDETVIEEPEGGRIALWDDSYDEEYSIFDADDYAAEKLVIKAK